MALMALTFQPAHASVEAIQSLIEKGRYPDAISLADEDLSTSPQDPQTRFLKGIALAELDRADEAIKVFQKLTEDYPELPEPYNNLAVLYAQRSEFDKAKGALEMAIRTHPSYATAHENLGDVYARLASNAYNKALQIDAGNTAAKSKLALIRELMTVSNRAGATLVAAAKPPAAPAPTAKPAAEPAPTNTPEPQAAPVATPAAPAAVPAPPAAATEPATPPGTTTADENQAKIETVLLAWAQAWSSKDVPSYLSYYAENFDPAGGKSLARWKSERQQRVGNKPGEISVDIENMNITLTDKNTAKAVFLQRYRSTGFSGSTYKTLTFARTQGKWRITHEQIGRH